MLSTAMERKRDRWAVWRETTPLGILRDVGNFLLFALRRFVNDGMTQAAGALTYSTLLALVPLLVIAFAVLSGFQAFDDVKLRMQALILGALVPEVGAGAQTYLASFTSNASNLTAVGIVALAAAAVLLLSTIEATLNRIWYVDHPRPLGRRLLIFWAVLTVGPLLFGASFTLTSDLAESTQRLLGTVDPADATFLESNWFRTIVAVIMQIAAFTLLYKIVPARHVNFRHALLGGIFSGIALQGLRYGFNLYLTSSTTYTTIYGAVAIFPIFLIWLYSCWTVVIIGAVLAASFPDWWRRRDTLAEVTLGPADRLEIAMAILAVLSRQALSGGAVSQDRLAEAVPLEAREESLEALRAARYVVTTENERISLARDLHRTRLADLAHDLGLLLGHGKDSRHVAVASRIGQANPGLADALLALREAEGDILGRTVADLLADAAEPRAGTDGLVALRKTP